MKKSGGCNVNYKFTYLIYFCLIFLFACGNIVNNKIATVKNNTNNMIVCALTSNDIMTDNILYGDTSYLSHLIKPHSYDTYMIDDSNLVKAPDSEKAYIYIISLDSVDKFKKLKIVNGILKHSLLKKIIIQVNKVQEPLDTVYVR
jgi:hypothetical protein